MHYRKLGGSGLVVPALSLGTGTFGGTGEFFGAWGTSDVKEATRLVDISLDAGMNLFDSGDVYSDGAAETILGRAIQGRRDQVLISTKGGLRLGHGPNDYGASRAHLIAAVEGSLRRLGTGHIDLYQIHGFDARTPLEETFSALDDLVRAGKIRYVGVSNFAGWQLMKALAISDQHGFVRPVAHQVYYSLIGRDYEWELLPLALDQHVGAIVWSPLGWGRLTGRIRRGQGLPSTSRLNTPIVSDLGPPVSDESLYQVVDALDLVAQETGRSVPQVAINWLLQRPTVASVIIGARTEAQLRDNLAAVEWTLTDEQRARLDAASATPPPYPSWPYVVQPGFAELSPRVASLGSPAAIRTTTLQ